MHFGQYQTLETMRERNSKWDDWILTRALCSRNLWSNVKLESCHSKTFISSGFNSPQLAAGEFNFKTTVNLLNVVGP